MIYFKSLSEMFGLKAQVSLLRDFLVFNFLVSISSKFNEIRFRKTGMKLPDPPIIVGGCGRSGTTLLHAIISAHEDVLSIPEETKAFSKMAHERGYVKEFGVFDIGLIYKRLHQIGINVEHKRWSEKTPRNIFSFAKLLKYYKGEVRLIHIVRDGRDVVLSNHPDGFSAKWVSAERWIRDTSVGAEFLEDPRVLQVRYEDLVLDNEKEVRRICAYLNLDYSSQMANWFEHAQVRKNKAWIGKLRPLDKSSIGRWKKHRDNAEIKKIQESVRGRELLEKYEYEL